VQIAGPINIRRVLGPRRARPLRLIVLGIIGGTPVAGVIWQALHYLEGFRRLGFDVYYVEDTGTWPYHPEKNTVTGDCTYTVGALARIMNDYGFAGRWAYVEATRGRRCYGLSQSSVRELFEEADVLINLTASTVLRDEHLDVPVRVYLETDPVLPQIEIAKGNKSFLDSLAAHTHHLSYGENLGAPDCAVPVEHFHYFPTRQPIVLDWWTAPQPPATTSSYTTIANWRQSGKDFDWKGQRYTWSKHHEFGKILDLPQRTSQPLELALALRSGAVNGQNAWSALDHEDADAVRLLRRHGWRVVNALDLAELPSYRNYIVSSRGEVTVAKDQNVRMRSGWFSDRSACYLAAGRPVITQETGFSKFLPCGEGLFAFATMEDILTAFERIDADERGQRQAARAIAEEYFKAENVLRRLIRDIGL